MIKKLTLATLLSLAFSSAADAHPNTNGGWADWFCSVKAHVWMPCFL